MLKKRRGKSNKNGKNILAIKIIEFCYKYNVFDESINKDEVRNVIENNLDKAHFVENLINTVIIKTKTHHGIDIEKVKELLLELEKIRLELEYKCCG